MDLVKRCAFAAAFGLAALVATQAAFATPKVGAVAPNFKLVTYDGKSVKLSDLAGQVVILNYWATWCGPCKREMVVMDAYVRTHPTLKIFAVSTEDSVPRGQLKPLAAALSFPLAFDLHGGGYGIMDAVPTSYVIDRGGVIRYAKAAAFDARTLDETVGPLLAATAPAPTTTTANP